MEHPEGFQPPPTPCVVWDGYIAPNGYGRFGRHGYAHRRAYEDTNGPIPDGLVWLAGAFTEGDR